MSNDPFSDILRMAEAQSIVSGGVAAGGTWALHVPASGQMAFCAIVKGACWLRLDGRKKAVRLEQGDVGLLSGREGFLLCSELTARPIEAPQTGSWGQVDTIGDGSGCTWLAGRVSLHPASAAFLTQALPSLVHVRASSPAAAPLRRIVEDLIEEQSAAFMGGSIASAQLAQLFFVKILRAHVASAGALPSGWLRAISDERIARALRLLHGDPGRDLNLDALAKVAGMSRTRFAVRFKAIAGTAPLTYLTGWRMRLAQRALREDDTSVAELAGSLGYASESAFSNAFKRVTGVAPRTYRSAARQRGSMGR